MANLHKYFVSLPAILQQMTFNIQTSMSNYMWLWFAMLITRTTCSLPQL